MYMPYKTLKFHPPQFPLVAQFLYPLSKRHAKSPFVTLSPIETKINDVSYHILQVGHDIQPNVIFSAHQHVSRIITYPPIQIKHFSHDSSPISFDLTQTIGNNYLEIMVPTASYRMGSTEIGYGHGIIGKC